MGKPIAGQNQFPYTVGGFLVDGANINGVTYAKKLYIYKQRSYDMYDLQDTSGNIYRFIRIGYRDTNRKMLNYFDTAENLVQTIPENTFFLKIQDPSRNIFSFVRIYQWHKCITVEGDYVYRTINIDPQLSGVLINPTISTIQVGKTLSYESLFYPSSYSDKDGNWFLNSLDGIRDNKSAELVSSELNTAILKGISTGKAVLSFVPSRNDALVTHSIVNVVQEDLPLELFKVFNTEQFSTYKYGQEYTLEVVTYPYDSELTEALTVEIDEPSYNDFSTETTLLSVSDDFKKYTFKTEFTGREEGNDYNQQYPVFTFSMKTPIEYSYSYSDIMVASELTYKNTYNSLGILFNFPSYLRPNMTYKVKSGVQGPNIKLYPYVSSDPEIATFDVDTATITTYDKKGTVTFTTQYMNYDGEIVSGVYAGGLTTRDDVYDMILRTPEKRMSIAPGESVKYTLTGYREGYDPVNIPLRKSIHPETYTIDDDGTVTASTDPSEIGQLVYIWVEAALSVDLQLLYEYRSPGTSFRIQPEGTIIPMTSMDTTTDYNNKTQFIRLADGYSDIIVYPRPNGCNNYAMEFEYYDESVIEIVDKDFLLNNFQYAMDGALFMHIKPLKTGSTEMIVRSVEYPDVKVTMKIVVY